ncbi:MAG: DUF2905 domain-containing protein [Nitrospirae bacterium]|nr:DUF2905 domain-containing protein [Nitrospirota bacterium]NTW66390.1 DUF2905 domain-containing protein [Nitrospirota bacterium]
MNELAKGLILLGAVLIAVGLILLFFQKVPFLGKLPGDILIKRENFTFYFPLATSIVVSLLISLILSVIGKFR